MKKLTIPFILSFTLGAFLILLTNTMPSQALPTQPMGQPASNQIIDIYTSRQMEDGLVSTAYQGVYGPQICTSWGDPFSPINSRYTPGLYSYRYRIEIPPNYPSDIVRVEIFDPDSINSATNNATVIRSNAAVTAGGLDPFVNASCNNSISRKSPCLIATGEINYSTGDPIGNLTLDQVNPYWFLRVDENRGNGTNACANVSGYSEAVNTRTRYELYYYKENADGTMQEVPLAAYTGQDGLEAVDHETDLHWVSPGAQVSFGWDKDLPGIDVPADPGSNTNNGFEIDLTSEIPNIVIDPKTGNRYVYLDITTLKGGSENNFELWAGPPDYVNSVPSEVNQRNIYLLNNPGSHSSKGVKVYAMGNLPQNSNADFPIDTPLTYVSPDQKGEVIFVSIFDTDAGARPPITFFFDTIAEEDWSLTFADSSTTYDPDGVPTTSRCLPGSCHDEWTDPPYQIKLPNGTEDCDFSNPTPEDCTPFYGGKLMVRYEGGRQDTYGWQLTQQNQNSQPIKNIDGCEAFPIAIHENIRSVTAPGSGANPFPYSSDFENPNPPLYQNFIYHQDNIPLAEANEGMVFRLQNGFGNEEFGWLQWNEGIISSATTLNNSLTWPGNSLDYINHGDGGQILPGQAHVVRGYIEAGDPTDAELHIGDWIAAYSGSASNNNIRATLNDHIAIGRTLRLPIWDQSEQSGNGAYRASAFAIFRIHGYNLSGGGESPWILLEFIRFDNSCGQLSTPLTAVSLAGANHALLNEDVTLTANILPMTATQPISYTWEATDFAPITQGSGISDTMTFNWAITGTKTITVTAVNPGGAVSDTHTVNVTNIVEGVDLTVVGTPQLITPLPIAESEPLEFAITVKNIGDTAITSQHFIDLFINPNNMSPEGIPPELSDGFSILYELDSGESKTINITLPEGLTKPNDAHQIYAMIDTFRSIGEANETNNVSAPLVFDASNFAEKKYIFLPMIIKN